MQRFSQNEQSLKIKLTFDGNKTLEVGVLTHWATRNIIVILKT